jgi:hypothetical protein
MKVRPMHVRMTKAKLIRLGYRKGSVDTKTLAAICISFAIFIPGWIWVCSKFLTHENMLAFITWVNGMLK